MFTKRARFFESSLRFALVKPERRACARGSKFGQDARSHSVYVASRRARAVRAKCRLAGLTSFARGAGAARAKR